MGRTAKGHGSETKLTGELTEKICVAVRQGATLDAAAAYAGVARSTFFDWLKRGRQQGARNPYKAFVAEVDEALAHFEVLAIGQIAKAGQDGEWQASAWRLERRFPDRYGRRTRVDGQVQVQAVPFIDLDKLTVQEAQTLLELLRKAAPSQEELPSNGRPALELVAGEIVEESG